jgi:ATP-dependent DNA helicase RecQ
LTEKCRLILRGEQTLELRKQVKQDKTTTDKKQKTAMRPQDKPLWDALRALRTSLAEDAGVPPYVIFHDVTLQEMVKKRPLTEQDMNRISGVGGQKLARYGKVFLAEISQYPLSELLDNRLSATVNETLVLYQQGIDIAQIALQRAVKASTIYTHLADAIEVGLLDVHDVTGLSKAEFNEIVFVLESQEDQEKGRLKPVYDELAGEYDYGLLKCVQAAI